MSVFSYCVQRAVDRGRRESCEETPAQKTKNDAGRTTVAAADPRDVVGETGRGRSETSTG